jgi:hypothetical protein
VADLGGHAQDALRMMQVSFLALFGRGAIDA